MKFKFSKKVFYKVLVVASALNLAAAFVIGPTRIIPGPSFSDVHLASSSKAITPIFDVMTASAWANLFLTVFSGFVMMVTVMFGVVTLIKGAFIAARRKYKKLEF